MNRENYAAAKKLVAGAKRILVSGHLSPDGDSLGSMIALTRLLRQAGREAFATADLNALGKPGFLEGVEDLIPVRKLKRQRKFDLFIAVDCASFERMPPEVRPLAEKLPKICIDHHVTRIKNFTFSIITIKTKIKYGTTHFGHLLIRFYNFDYFGLFWIY